MGKYWKLLAEDDAETTAYSAATGTISGAKSPYTPPENARLIGLRCMEGSVAATTVLTAAQWKLTSASFKPNSIEVGINGSALHTAPTGPLNTMDWVVDQPVKAGVPITIEVRIIGAMTNVTVEHYLWGLFQS